MLVMCPKCGETTQDLVEVFYKCYLCPKCCIKYRDEEISAGHELFVKWFGVGNSLCECHRVERKTNQSTKAYLTTD
jgi:hypothetical protein